MVQMMNAALTTVFGFDLCPKHIANWVGAASSIKDMAVAAVIGRRACRLEEGYSNLNGRLAEVRFAAKDA
jgi:hypothetical protein